MNEPQTLIDKLWAAHEIVRREDGSRCSGSTAITSTKVRSMPSASCESAARKVAEPDLTFGVADHYVPTRGARRESPTPRSPRMVRQLEANTAQARHQAVRAATIRARASCMSSAPSRA